MARRKSAQRPQKPKARNQSSAPKLTKANLKESARNLNAPARNLKDAARNKDTARNLKGKAAAAVILTPPADAPYPVVGIGASAGGLEACSELLRAMPDNTGMAFVLVHHLDPTHESILPQLLARATRLPVGVVRNGLVPKPNHVYVIPPNFSMELSGGRLRLSNRGVAVRPMPVDEFFCSLAKELGSHAIGVVLSGSASDGTIGLRAIKAEGGVTFAQDEKSAKYTGMPHSAIATGCVDFILPPDRIAVELDRIGRHPYLAAAPGTLPTGPLSRPSVTQEAIALIRARTKCDFSGYKLATVERRIQRRMALGKFENVDKYLLHLRKDPDEVQALCRDMLIHVTEFFREPEVFETLKREVLPRLLTDRTSDDLLRVWIPGCSTGEEVYSIAIALLEGLRGRRIRPTLQIFGTDLSEEAISTARTGFYPQAAVVKVSADRLRRYFVKTDHGYQLNKAVRALCIFARHDLVNDPPFSRLDLISCRNVLIYMDSDLQDRVVNLFHYALKPHGTLLVGKSETLRAQSDLFAVQDRKHKIYLRNGALAPVGPPRHRTEVAPTPFSDYRVPEDVASPDLLKAAERVIWERYLPATIVVNSDLQILRFYGDLSPYLKPAAGAASLRLLKMVREELMMELRTLIHQAKKTDVVRSEPIQVGSNGHPRQVVLEVATIKSGNGSGSDFIIVFRDFVSTPAKAALKGKSGADATAKMRRELTSVRDYLRSVIEDLEVTNEELKVANEEVLSNNEELQTVNEELESSKEELQSSNEELTTLNDELTIRNAEVEEGREFANAIVETVREPLVVLDRDFRVVTANSAFYQTFRAKPEQTVNVRIFDLGGRQWDIPQLRQLLADVLEKDASFADLEVDHEFPVIGWRRILLNARRVLRRQDGNPRLILLAMEDVTQRKNAEEALQERESTLSTLLESASQAIVVVNPAGRIVLVNAMAERTSGYRRAELLQMHVSELTPPRFRKRISALLTRIFSDSSPRMMGVVRKLLGQRKTGGEFPLEATLSMMQTREGSLAVILCTDVTDRKRSEDSLRASEIALRHSHRLLRGLTSRLLAAQEEERRRISRELHDNLNQQLAMLVVEVERLEKETPRNTLRKQLELIRQRAEAISDDVRRTAYQLHPSMLEHLGLVSALRSLCAGYKSQGSLHVDFKQRRVPKAISSDIALCLYRIAQEALANVIKHSGSKDATLTLTGSKQTLQMVVEDGGIGFDVNSASQNKGLGIESMNERVRLVGGTISIRSMPGETIVEAEVPLTAPPPPASSSGTSSSDS